jgi:hypothetical protein
MAFFISALKKPQNSLGDCDLTNDVSVQTAGSVVQHGPDCDAVNLPTVYPSTDVSVSSFEMAFIFSGSLLLPGRYFLRHICPVGNFCGTSVAYSKSTPLAARSVLSAAHL